MAKTSPYLLSLFQWIIIYSGIRIPKTYAKDFFRLLNMISIFVYSPEI